ncbi:MAG: hypothetical protein LBR18_06770 [Tannerella sp.]|jgi:hypothetical protein|nr:hypothetical protein [Tannerella sp.]
MIDIIKNTIDKYPLGYIFTTNGFSLSVKNPKGVNKVLNDLLRRAIYASSPKDDSTSLKSEKIGELPFSDYEIACPIKEERTYFLP